MAVDVLPVSSGFNLVDFLNGRGGLADNLINLLFAVAGAAGVIYIVWAGVRYITSGGDPAKTKAARQGIINAMIGIVITMSAFAIIRLAVLISRTGEGIATGNFTVSTPAPRPTKTVEPDPAATSSINGTTYRAVALATLDQYQVTRVLDASGNPIASGTGGECTILDYSVPNACKICYENQTQLCLSGDGFIPVLGVSFGGKYDQLRNCIADANRRSDIYSCLSTIAGNNNGAEWICRLYNEENPGSNCPYD